MATITDYRSLKTEIEAYLQRNDLLDADYDGFVQLCTSRLNRDLDAFRLESEASLDVTSGEAELPEDFGNILSLRMDVYPNPPRYYTPQAFHSEFEKDWPNQNPSLFTIENSLLKVKPTPDKTANAIIVYKAKLAPLVDDTDTNVILLSDPDLYLYGSLIASEPRIGNDPRMLTWATLYDVAVVAKNEETRRERFPSANIRMTQSARPNRLRRAVTAQSSS